MLGFFSLFRYSYIEVDGEKKKDIKEKEKIGDRIENKEHEKVDDGEREKRVIKKNNKKVKPWQKEWISEEQKGNVFTSSPSLVRANFPVVIVIVSSQVEEPATFQKGASTVRLQLKRLHLVCFMGDQRILRHLVERKARCHLHSIKLTKPVLGRI